MLHWQRWRRSLASRKFVLTVAAMVAVFYGWITGHDPSQLAIVIPAILAFYISGDVAEKHSARITNADIDKE